MKKTNSAQRFQYRLSAIITTLYSLITIICISIANSTKNQSNYSPIFAFRAIIRAIRDTSHQSRITSHLGTNLEQIQELH